MQPGGFETYQRIKIDVVRERKGQAAFSLFVLSRGHKDVRHAERKDLTRGPTEHVYKGKIGAQGLPDFRRAWDNGILVS